MLSSSVLHLIETEEFRHYAQGLFDTNNWSIIGKEVLLRSNLGTPDVIFQAAKNANKLYELETKAIHKALRSFNFKAKSQPHLLFINIFPSTILHPDFLNFITSLSLQFSDTKEKVVFEIIETDCVECILSLKERVTFMKSLGYFIAIDDVGKGWSSLNMIIEMEPHYIKLDRYFSINLSESPSKQEMIKSILHYTHYSNSKLVLEGIEHSTDLAIAKLLGVDICQGFLLEKPQPIAVLV